LQATQRLQQGDLTTRVPAMLDSDLAQLADAFNSMAQALAQTQQRLEQEQKVKTWQEAAKQLAHEIKNPLTPIQLATERLQRKLGKQLADDPVFHGCTTTILEQVATIQELIKHFVQFASLPAVCLQECNMARLIEEVLLLYRVSYPAVDFIVEIDQEAPWVTIMTDGAKIKLALVNLIDNSLRAMHLQQDASAHAIIISLQHDAQAHELVLTLADTGPGVAAQVRETLFLPHVSTSKKNMGLGLAIVFQLFKQLGGSICLAPSKRGALFVCRLPCHKAVPKD
jgi:two-component system nitrogen regulation sensor histidine kinase NtrY